MFKKNRGTDRDGMPGTEPGKYRNRKMHSVWTEWYDRNIRKDILTCNGDETGIADCI